MSASAPPNPVRKSDSGDPQARSASDPLPRSASDELIEARIQEACRSLWWAEFVRRCLRLVLGVLAAIIAWIVVDHWVFAASPIVRTLALGSGIVAVVAYVYFQIWPLAGTSVQPEYAARSLERTNPELRHSLTSYVTLRRHRQDGGLSGRVVRSLGSTTAGYLKTHDELPEEATGTIRWWVATAVMLAGLLAYAALSPKNSLQSVSRLLAPMAEIQPSTRVQITDVSPGDAEAIAGRSVRVTAQIRGLVPRDERDCRLELTSGERGFPLVGSENEGEFAFETMIDVPSSASGTIAYSLVAGDAVAGPYHLHVKDVPVIALESIRYQPPAYTGREPYSRTTGAISAIDGTNITLTARCNRPVARGTIEFNPKPVGDRIQATDGAIELQVSDDGMQVSATFPLRIAAGRSREVRRDSYRVRVWDAAGSGNPDPIIYPIDIIADLPPEIAIMLPTRSPQDVPLTAQQMIEVHASDADFGLTEIKLKIERGIQTLGEPVLWSNETGKVGNQVAEYRLRPAEMGLEVGDVVRVTAFATDNRRLENSSNSTANVTVTDTIQLRIVADSDVPPAGQADENGISEPDDQPAADPSGEDDSSGDQSGDGKPQAGGEQGSQGQSGGSGESADQQETGGSGGDGSTENQGEGEGDGGGESGDAGESEGQNQGDPSGDMSDGQESGEQPSSEQGSGGQESGSQESGEGMQENPSPSNGEQSAGEQGAGDQDPASQEAGEQSSGDPSAGEQKSAGGDSQDDQGSRAGDSSSESSPEGADQNKQGDAQGGKPENGEPQNADAPPEGKPQHDGEAFERIRDYLEKQKQEQQGSGEKSEQAKDGQQNQQQDQQQGQREPGSDASSSDSPSPGDQEPSQNGEDGKPQQGNPQQGEPQEGKPGQEPQRGEKPAEGEAASNDATGESPDQNPDQDGSMESGSESQEGQPSGADSSETPDGEPGEQNGSGENQPGSESAAGDPSQAQSDPAAESSNETPQGDQASDGTPPPMQGNPGSTDGSEGNTDGGEQIQDPVDEINEDYAKEATDMVLDYLDQTRDQPDQDLLEQLDWTESDLQRFRDRWEKVRELEKAPATDGQAKRELEDAMRSLGLKPPSKTSNTQTRDDADSLRGIRDSGNRRPPPAAYRDAFDAFRRSLSK